MIRFEDFGFRYEDAEEWALRNITTSVRQGEILLVLGPSGCGKSTLALALNGAVPHLLKGAVEGAVTVGGLDTLEHDVSRLANHVGMVFQDPEVQLFALTVEDEVAMSLESHGVPREEMREHVERAMALCGLEGMELDAPAKLSGGQKQRVAIAAVLAREPEVLVFDEPTGNLDPLGSRSVYETIRRICDERGRTVILVEQDLAPVVDLVDRVLILDEGRIQFEGRPRETLRELDLLYRCGVKVPVATELALSLEARSLANIEHVPATVTEAVELIAARATSDPRTGMSRTTHPQSDPQPAQDGHPVVSFQHVTHVYDTGHAAIQDLELDIHKGEFVALCGMNGAGKTTAVLHIMGLLKPTSGSVLVAGEDVASRSVAEMARSVGLIFQNPNHQLFKDSVQDEIAFGPRNLGWDEDRIEAKLVEVLELVGLADCRTREPEGLSIGQKQRVAIASVLVMEPSVIILDEPTTGQDQRTMEPFMSLVSRLRTKGLTVVMITHDMDVVLRHASRMVVLNNGSLVADGPPVEVFTNDEILASARLHPPPILELSRSLGMDHATTVEQLSDGLSSSLAGEPT